MTDNYTTQNLAPKEFKKLNNPHIKKIDDNKGGDKKQEKKMEAEQYKEKIAKEVRKLKIKNLMQFKYY
jgi:hypothetical protein